MTRNSEAGPTGAAFEPSIVPLQVSHGFARTLAIGAAHGALPQPTSAAAQPSHGPGAPLAFDASRLPSRRVQERPQPRGLRRREDLRQPVDRLLGVEEHLAT